MTINNFGQVSGTIYRGAQPTQAQFAELKEIGVAVVLDLREDFERQQEAAACVALGMQHVNVPIGNQNIPIIGELGILPPTKEQVQQAMCILIKWRENMEGLPMTRQWAKSAGFVFIHCAHGADRTGAIVAAYRILHDKWTATQAMTEARHYGINPAQVLIKEWIENFQAKEYAPAV